MSDNKKESKILNVNKFEPKYKKLTPYERKMTELSNDISDKKPDKTLRSLRGIFNSEMKE